MMRAAAIAAALAAVAISTATAAVSASASTTTPAAYGLTASPPAIHASPGTTVSVRAFDTGTTPLKVAVTLVSVAKQAGRCEPSSAAVRDVTLISAPHFTLRPGTAATAVVTIGRKAGGQDLAVVFSAGPPGGHGNVRVVGSVGSQLVISGSGPHGVRTAGCTTAGKPGRTTTAGAVTAGNDTRKGSAADGISFLGVLAAGTGGTVWGIRRRIRRRRQAAHSQ